jgi:hypothetical protein
LEEKEKYPDSVGKVIFSAEVRVIDPRGEDVPVGEVAPMGKVTRFRLVEQYSNK